MQIKEYTLGKTFLRFFIDDDGRTSMYMVPESKKDEIKNGWEVPNDPWTARAPYMHEWRVGRLVHFHLAHHSIPVTGGDSLKFSGESDLVFEDQTIEKDGKVTLIKTYLKSQEGHKVVNNIKHKEGYEAFWTWNEFTNTSDKMVTLDYIASFGFDNVSPFAVDDSRNRMVLHRFLSSWAMEGRYQREDFEEVSLEKGWQGFCNDRSLRFGNRGSWYTRNYFPLVAVQDKIANVYWTAQLHANCSWQYDISRDSDSVSFTGGLADGDFGAWFKNIESGETFITPMASISATDKDLDYACQSVVKLQEEARLVYGEEGLPLSYNEFCTTWAHPTQESFMRYVKKAAEFGVKYVVVDDGWGKNSAGQPAVGDWVVNEKVFPDMKAMNREIRQMGLIPGIWFEIESTLRGSDFFGPEYDDLHVKKRGTVIKFGGKRSFWDMTNPEVEKILTERVIDMLKENDFGYIKIDYNGNIGVGVDGAESLGEGLRLQGEGIRRFYEKIKKEIPDIIIENCASGGNRNTPVLLGVSGVASSSDAHESIEIPIVSANMHYHMLPAQSLVWAVFHKDDSIQRFEYSLSATLLGRPCFSGEIDEITDEQSAVIHKFVDFYKKTETIVKDGITHIYRELGKSMRYPKGTQTVVRNTDDEMVVICHSFDEPYDKTMEIEIPEGFQISAEFANKAISIEGNKIKVKPMDSFTGCAVYAVKK